MRIDAWRRRPTSIVLAALFFLLATSAAWIAAGLSPSPYRIELMVLGAVAGAGALAIYLIPWRRLPRSARVSIPVAGLAIMAANAAIGMQGPATYGTFLLLIVLWIGFSLSLRTAVFFAVAGGVLYALLYPEGSGPSGALVEAFVLAAVSLIVGTSMSRAVLQIRDSEARLRDAQEAARIGSWECREGSRTVRGSPQLFRLFATDPEARSRPRSWFLRRLHPDDRARLADAVRGTASSGAAFRIDLHLEDSDGGARILECRGQLEPEDPFGRPARMHGTVQDVTDSRETAAEREELEIRRQLRRTEERYRRFFEEDLTGDFVTTADGTIVECNDALARFFGYEQAGELRGRNVQRFYLHEGDRESMLEELREHGTIERHEREFRRHDGRVVTAILNSIGEFDEEGELVGLRGYLFDITDLKLLEAQLRQAQKMEAVGRLAGGIAHDFNNMLAAIRGHVELVLRDLPREGSARADLEEVRRTVDRATALTRKLLAFSRRQVLKPTVVDLSRAVEDTAGMLRRLIGADIDLEVVPADEPCAVRVDPGQMEQVLMNLATNARDAMPAGGRLTFRIQRAEITPAEAARYPYTVAPGRYALLRVADTGQGMTAEVREQVFDPFFTTKPPERGTGLGLATVFGAIKQSDGYIWVDSAPGEGTEFRLYFPLLRGAAPDAGQPAAEDGPETNGPAGLVVLLAEDEAAVRSFVQRVLERQGMRVLAAASAADAIEAYRTHASPVDVLLTDVVMPGMTGRELADRLHRERPDLPVVYMSGYTEDEVLRRGVAVEGQHFLQKPFSHETLVETVTRAVSQ